MLKNVKNVLVVAALAVSGVVSAQESAFVGSKVESLLGVLVKVADVHNELQKYGYREFFTDSTLASNTTYKQSKESYSTPYTELNRKEFRVTKVQESRSSNVFLQLQNDEVGTIYYKYDKVYDFNCKLDLVSIPEGFYCSQVDMEKDKFSSKVTYRTDLLKPISFTKVTENGIESLYMSLETGGSTVNVNINGVKILLENGEILEFDNEVDVRVRKGYVYSSFIKLTPEVVEKLTNFAITDFELYIYGQSVKDGNVYKELLKCISTK